MNATSFFAAAASLRSAAAVVSDERSRVTAETRTLAAVGTGEALRVLQERLRHLDSPLEQRETQLRGVAEVLEQSGILARVLEKAVAALEPVVDSSPTAAALLRQLDSMGTALDVMCAQQISRLCAPTPDPGGPGWADYPELGVDDLHELNLLTAPDTVRGLADEHPDLRILETPDGGLVAAVGDLETADSVITYVAGVGSSDPTGWSVQVDRTRDLARATGGPTAAGVLWLGYPAPESLGQALQHSPARAAGQELAEFQAELARRRPDQQRSVLGYSYGSVVVGEAARRGLDADDVILLASPGVGVGSVAEMELHGENPRVHVFTSPGDPISLLTGPRGGVHGVDPGSPGFGARPWDPGVTGDHNSYFDSPDFLAAVGEAVRAP